MDEQKDGWMDRWIGGWMDGWMDNPSAEGVQIYFLLSSITFIKRVKVLHLSFQVSAQPRNESYSLLCTYSLGSHVAQW